MHARWLTKTSTTEWSAGGAYIVSYVCAHQQGRLNCSRVPHHPRWSPGCAVLISLPGTAQLWINAGDERASRAVVVFQQLEHVVERIVEPRIARRKQESSGLQACSRDRPGRARNLHVQLMPPWMFCEYVRASRTRDLAPRQDLIGFLPPFSDRSGCNVLICHGSHPPNLRLINNYLPERGISLPERRSGTK